MSEIGEAELAVAARSGAVVDGVTGGGSEMRVGDRGVTITGQSSLISQSSAWTPAHR